jgi:hypothetical protein
MKIDVLVDVVLVNQLGLNGVVKVLRAAGQHFVSQLHRLFSALPAAILIAMKPKGLRRRYTSN